jgi:hypothetical protein
MGDSVRAITVTDNTTVILSEAKDEHEEIQ